MTSTVVPAMRTYWRVPASRACLLLVAVAIAVAVAVTARAAEPPADPAAPTAAAPSPDARSGLVALAGRWSVDLRPSLDAPAYDKPMVLEIATDGSVRGSFYDSAIEAGRASASNGRTCFAFRTTDGVGPYQTSGCLVGERIVGQTWAEHRRFMLNWTAVRE